MPHGQQVRAGGIGASAYRAHRAKKPPRGATGSKEVITKALSCENELEPRVLQKHI